MSLTGGMSQTDRAVLWGFLAFIAYELWKPSGLAALPLPGSPGSVSLTTVSPPDSVAPSWVQQLSGQLTWMDEQGVIHQNADFYTPTRGMFGRCY